MRYYQKKHMRYFTLSILILIVFSACKRVQKDDKVYLAFRDNSTNEIMFTEEVEVEQSKASFMIIKTVSTGNVSYLEKENGSYQGQVELFRWNSAFVICSIELDRKNLGRILMKGEFSGVSQEWKNGQFTGNQSLISGTLELLD